MGRQIISSAIMKVFFGWVKKRDIRVTPETNETKFVSLTDEDHIEILSVVEEGDHLWFCTTDGIWIVNKKDLQLQHLNIFDQSFTSSFYDQQMKQIYLGGVDGIVHFSPDILNKKVPEPNINLTALYINNKLFKPGNKSNRSSIRYLNQIILNYTRITWFLSSPILFFPERKTDGSCTNWKTWMRAGTFWIKIQTVFPMQT